MNSNNSFEKGIVLGSFSALSLGAVYFIAKHWFTPPKSLHKAKLSYFDFAGKAEAIRLVLHHADIDFIDDRIQMEDWIQFKAEHNVHQVPILTLKDGTVLSQSNAILRFVGRESGLYPEDPFEASKVDEMIDLIEDIHVWVWHAVNEKGQEKKKEIRRRMVEEGILEKYFTCLEKVFKESKTSQRKFAANNNLSIADFLLYARIEFWVNGTIDGIPASVVSSFPHLLAHHRRISVLSSIQSWYSKK